MGTDEDRLLNLTHRLASALLGALLGAGLAFLGGDALDAIGVAALAIGATVIVAAPILLIERPTEAAAREAA